MISCFDSKRSIIYRIWCFFMDSEKGLTEYWKQCNDISEKENSEFSHIFMTFEPYPGRFKWRKWKIFHLIRKLKFKWRCRNLPKSKPDDILKVVHIGTANSHHADLFQEYPLKSIDEILAYIDNYRKDK